MRRRGAAALCLVVLVACAGGDGDSNAEGEQPTPTAQELRAQTVGCDPEQIRADAKELADKFAKGKLSQIIESQDVMALPIAYGVVEGDVIADLEENGPFEGGEECLLAFAESKELLNSAAALALGEPNAMFDERDVAETWQALLTYYPDTEARTDAENSLTELGYPIP